MTSTPDLPCRLAAEFLGSALLAAIVIGGGIAGVLIIKFLYPALTPAQTPGVTVLHAAGDSLAGQDGTGQGGNGRDAALGRRVTSNGR